MRVKKIKMKEISHPPLPKNMAFYTHPDPAPYDFRARLGIRLLVGFGPGDQVYRNATTEYRNYPVRFLVRLLFFSLHARGSSL